jgi:hypothetical protein
MRTELVLQVAPVTAAVSKRKFLKSTIGGVCSITMAAMLMGCTRPDKERDSSTKPEMAQKALADKSRSGPKAQTACDLLTAGEIAGILKTPQVIKDEFDSRKNEFTKLDFCYWWPRGKVNPDRDERIELRLRRAESADEGSLLLLFSAAKGDAVENDNQRDQAAQPVAGVGDEAIYSPFPDGGSIALRVGTSAVTISGLLTKDQLVSMAKLMANRL